MAVVEQARAAGLDVLTLPSHTSHVLQPLDVSIFKPFKTAFRMYRDVWSLSNKGKSATKEVLAQWISLALRKATTSANIQKGLRAIGIWPLEPTAMATKMAPSECFSRSRPQAEEVVALDIGAVQLELSSLRIAEVNEDHVQETQPNGTVALPCQYFVNISGMCS
jgi:hypothetical protein